MVHHDLVIHEFFSFSEITFYMHVYTRGLFEFLNKRQTARDISIEHPEWVEREFSKCYSISWKSEVSRRRGYHSRSVIDQWIIS